jgi:hypothetical protein
MADFKIAYDETMGFEGKNLIRRIGVGPLRIFGRSFSIWRMGYGKTEYIKR